LKKVYNTRQKQVFEWQNGNPPCIHPVASKFAPKDAQK